jgi:DNA-binding response OmpR family regulator
MHRIAARRRPPAVTHQPTVLLVEEEEQARDLLTRALVREGYLVLSAATGHDAIGSLHAPLEPIDVVLLDVRLPDVRGVDLCARVRELHPGLPIVACTTGAEPEDARDLAGLGVRRYFHKPIAVAEVLAAVHDALPPRHATPVFRPGRWAGRPRATG